MADHTGPQRVHGFCGLCIARCGTIATVEDGRFTRLDPDPTHPTGQAICAKGRAAPELVYHPERLTHPLRRTRPKGDRDPGWERIGWDQALDLTAAAMRGIADRHGPEAFVFSLSSPSTTAIGNSTPYIRRLMNAFGTPNAVNSLDVCGWGRAFATRFTFGVGSVATGGGGGAMPDIANSGCLILWGYNPSFTRITHATAVIEAQKRGMRLIVVDPRHVGLANKADVWLRVRPGTDGALALGIAQPDDPAGLVRPRLHPHLEQRAVAGARRYRPPADRTRPRTRWRHATPAGVGRCGREAGPLRHRRRPL